MKYVTLGDIRTDIRGLVLESISLPLYPELRRDRKEVSGRLGALAAGAAVMVPYQAEIKLAYKGTREGMMAALRGLAQATTLSAPDIDGWYDGYIDGAGEPRRLSRQWWGVTVHFMCDPPLRNVVAGKYMPTALLPIPEQLGAGACTTLKVMTGATKVSVAAGGAYPARVYYRIDGAFTWIQIGGLKVDSAQASGSLYIDGEHQQVYRLQKGVRTCVDASGEFPEITGTEDLSILGTGINATLYVLAIGRL